MRLADDDTTVPQVMKENGYQLEGGQWVFRGERGESRLPEGPLAGLLRESGSRRLRLYVQQEKARCQEK
jgi:hypothetical protein